MYSWKKSRPPSPCIPAEPKPDGNGRTKATTPITLWSRRTHVHDNYYSKDLHLTPFAGDIDWEEQMRTLKEIGYTGNLTFEFVYGSRPAALLRDFLHSA